MIPFDEACHMMMSHAVLTGSERISLDHALDRVLVEKVEADRDMPPFHKSAVDGYACIEPQPHQELGVLETIAAGQTPERTLTPGFCSKVMTGAQVPEGTTHVVMVEETNELDDQRIRLNHPGSKTNIALQGEDFKAGDPVLYPGTWLKPQHIAILAAVGHTRPLVALRPAIGLLTTGNELVEPHQQPGAGQIRNTNAIQLITQFRSLRLDVSYPGIVGDQQEQVRQAIEKSLEENHLTVLTGGVSMGDHDYVPAMMEKAGVEILFHKIAMKPGKPTIFGKKGDRLIIGLPGNPVSTFLQFEMLIKPLLYKMMGASYEPGLCRVPLAHEVRQKKSDRDSWKPVRIADGKVRVLPYHGSGHLHALRLAEGFICIPAGTTLLKEGSDVDVRPV